MSILKLYVDGSHIKGTEKLGYGAWGVFTNGKEFILSGTEKNPLFKKLRNKHPNISFSNPTMELFGLFISLSKCIDIHNLNVVVHQDYSGAVNFGYLWSISSGKPRAAKPWNAKEPYIVYLVNCIEVMCKCIIENGGSVEIKWVPGHQTSGEHSVGNNKADALAKSREDKFISPFVIDKENE